MYCLDSGLSYPSGNCSEGYYCPPGEIYPNPNDKLCQPGHYCPVSSKQQAVCKPGFYQQSAGMGECIECTPGFYCDPTTLGIGENNSSQGVVTPSVCPPGFFCPKGTITFNSFPCMKGYFSNQSQLSSHDQCYPCTPGYYCDKEAMTSPAGKCNAGFYCDKKAIVPNPSNVSDGGGPCDQGFYCESGFSNQLPCPVGTYGNRTKLGIVTECTSCDVGMYCDVPGLKSPKGACSPGYFCLGNSTEFSPLNKYYGDICPQGHYCPLATPIPYACPPGTYNNNTGASQSSDCQPCDGGFYCNGFGNKLPDGQCNPGYFCKHAAYTPTPLEVPSYVFNYSTCPIYSVNQTGGICKKGTYCPKGSIYPKNCDKGKFCDLDGLAAPAGNCSAGYYCDFNSILPNPRECQIGHYCPEGTLFEVPCPIGTFNPFTKQSEIGNCLNCTAGYFCPYPGMFETSFVCLQGFYCPPRSTTNSTLECPLGFFCPTGSGHPLPCPAGKIYPILNVIN